MSTSRNRLLIGAGAVAILAAAGLAFNATCAAHVATQPVANQDRAMPSGENVATDNLVNRSSGYPGPMGDDAEAAIKDPKNKDKWIGMTRGADGKLHVDKIVDGPDLEMDARPAKNAK